MSKTAEIAPDRRLLTHDAIDENNTHFQCRLCEPEKFCLNNHLTVCPSHSVSSTGSDEISDCFCIAGYYQDAPFTAGGSCKACEPKFSHSGHKKDVDGHLACPANSVSDAYSSTVADCLCVVVHTAGARQDANFADYSIACSQGTYKETLAVSRVHLVRQTSTVTWQVPKTVQYETFSKQLDSDRRAAYVPELLRD